MKLVKSKHKEFLKMAAILALPIAFQNLITNLGNTVDTIMVGQLGETAVAGVGLANQIFFVLTLMIFGIASGASVFISQAWGKGDKETIRKMFVISVVLSFLISIVFTVIAIVNPRIMLRVFTDKEPMIAVGIEYLRLIALCYIPAAISISVGFCLRSIGRTSIVLKMAIFTLVTNSIINYLLIFGSLGFPKLGVSGAAIATVIARVLEVVIIVIVLYAKHGDVAPKMRDVKGIDLDIMGKYIKTSSPVFINETMWGLGFALYSAIFGRMGEAAVAGVNVAQVFERTINVFFFGFAYAAGIMIGKAIGAGEPRKAKLYSKLFNRYTVILSGVFAVFIIAVSYPYTFLYNIDNETRISAALTIVAIGIFLPIKNSNLVNIVGVLRSGGDTKFCMFLDILGIWAMSLPLGFITGIIFGLPIPIVYMFMLVEEIMKFVLVKFRMKNEKWINCVV